MLCTCTRTSYQATHVRYACTWYGTSKAAGQDSKMIEGGEREMAEKHAVSRTGCISKHQELVKEVSEDQSTIIDALHKAPNSSILSSQVC